MKDYNAYQWTLPVQLLICLFVSTSLFQHLPTAFKCTPVLNQKRLRIYRGSSMQCRPYRTESAAVSWCSCGPYQCAFQPYQSRGRVPRDQRLERACLQPRQSVTRERQQGTSIDDTNKAMNSVLVKKLLSLTEHVTMSLMCHEQLWIVNYKLFVCSLYWKANDQTKWKGWQSVGKTS